MKVLNFGSLNVDLVYRVPHIVEPGETLSASCVQSFAGGKGANQSVALAKAGLQVWHAGTLGQDGLWILDILKEYGVNTDLVRLGEGPSGQAIIQVSDTGENSIILLGGGNREITEGQIEESLAPFASGDYLVLQNEINNTKRIIQKAFKKGMKICLNPAPFTEEVRTWPLEKLALLAVNEIEGAALAGEPGSSENVLKKLTETFPEVEILLTAGKQGAYYGWGSVKEYAPIQEVPVVDTTAAGDTFLGYFLASRLNGYGVKQAMERAARASAVTVSRPGAMKAIPRASELS